MAVTQQTNTQLNASIFNDTANASTAVAVKASSSVVYQIVLNNAANAAASYLKLYNLGSGSVTVGTTVPDEIILAPASTTVTLLYPLGKTFATALTAATVTVGGTTGTVSPSSSVVVTIAYT